MHQRFLFWAFTYLNIHIQFFKINPSLAMGVLKTSLSLFRQCQFEVYWLFFNINTHSLRPEQTPKFRTFSLVTFILIYMAKCSENFSFTRHFHRFHCRLILFKRKLYEIQQSWLCIWSAINIFSLFNHRSRYLMWYKCLYSGLSIWKLLQQVLVSWNLHNGNGKSPCSLILSRLCTKEYFHYKIISIRCIPVQLMW